MMQRTKIWSQVAPFSGNRQEMMLLLLYQAEKLMLEQVMTDVTTLTTDTKKIFINIHLQPIHWKAVADFPGVPRQYASAFTVGDNGYVGLGYNRSGYYQDIYKYNAATDTWTEMATFLGGKRRGASTFTIGNIAYVGFGTNNSGTNVRDLYQFEPAGNGGKGLWTQKTVFNDDNGDFPPARANAFRSCD